jgi:hypothetical protein
MATRLKLDDLFDLRGIDRRQFDEAHEDALSRDGKENLASLDAMLLKKPGQGGGDELGALLFLVGIKPQLRQPELKEGQRSAAADSKFGEFERAGAKIDRDDFMGGHE